MLPGSTSAAPARASLPLGFLALLFFALLGVASGCGQVITLTPTPTPEPTPTVGMEVAVATLPPTATPAPYTPAPTPTPTITPTPVIHTIASGESLLAIAGRYDVSVAALQDANGILDPRLLQVGQQLVIPRPEEIEDEASANSTPTPTPLPMQAENVYLNDTKIGGLWVLGEMFNPGADALEQVRVGVTLLDENDQQLATAEGLVAVDLVDPGARAPFALTFGESPGAFARYRVYALHAVPAYVGSYYRDLEVLDVESEGERYASYTVTGLIRNVGPEDAVDVQAIVTAYDALGRVIAVRKVTPEYNVVPRGGETPFTAVVAPVGGPVERFAVVAQGRRLPPPQ